MEQQNPSTTSIQIRQDSSESGPSISNILHDYDDDETVTKKLAKYGYDYDVDVKPAAAATCNSNQEAVTVSDSAPESTSHSQSIPTTSPSVSTTTTTEIPIDPKDMADAIREFALLKAESRALRNEIVRLQTELPRDLEVNSRRVTQDLESQVAAVISSQFQLSESQVTRATVSTSGEGGDQDTIVTDAAIRGESTQEITPQVEAALPEASPVVQAISATLVNSIHTEDENEPVYDARRVSYDGDETMQHHCQRIMKQNRKKLVGAGLVLLLAVVFVVLGVGGVFTSESQPLIVIPELNTANPSISHVPTVSSAPSSTQTPSIQPSTSISPTETCYWIDILIDYDDDPVSRSFPFVLFLCPHYHLHSSFYSILSPIARNII